MPSLPLSRATLERLGPTIRTPGYDLSDLTPGIVHLGVGGFHRAHMARYTHDLMERSPEAQRWAIVGAGLRPADRAMVEALTPQESLYTLIERDGVSETVSVIGSIRRLIYAGETSAELLDAIDEAGVRVVSLTVTEAGYGLNSATKVLDPDNPAIAHDLADPEHPRSAVGVIVEAYRRRMVAGRAAFTALSCDNIQHNGDVLSAAVLAFAARCDSALADWIAAKARFPNSMVDRITPITNPADTADLAARHGVTDNWPAFCETFRQWVIEDDFADGRPAWEAVGAQFVTEVAPYEFMKLRLLNASHLAIAALGRLAGCHFIHEVMEDENLRRYMAALMARETGPTVPPIAGVDLAAYQTELIKRFANPTIRDTVERVNTDAPLNYLLDPIRDRLVAGQAVDLLALGVAAWMRRMRGLDEAGQPIDIRHPLAALLKERAIEGGSDPAPMLAVEALFGDLGRNQAFVATVGRWLANLYEVGAATTLAQARQDLAF